MLHAIVYSGFVLYYAFTLNLMSTSYQCLGLLVTIKHYSVWRPCTPGAHGGRIYLIHKQEQCNSVISTDTILLNALARIIASK